MEADKQLQKHYDITVIEDSKKIPLPEKTPSKVKLLLKGAAIEDHGDIERRSPHLPTRFTLILGKTDKDENRIVSSADGKSYDAEINSALGTNIASNLKAEIAIVNHYNDNHSRYHSNAENRLVYNLSDADAERLYKYGVPKIIYHSEARNEDIKGDKKLLLQPNPDIGGKPLEGIRKKAFEEVSGLTIRR